MNIRNISDYVAGWVKRSPATFVFHIALLAIVAGALVTCFHAQHGRISIYKDVEAEHAQADDGEYFDLPFALRLNDCWIDYYPASTAAQGYNCRVTVSKPGEKPRTALISMDNMLIEDQYRFTLVSIGMDSATLAVNHDPWGILITYSGYGLMFVAMVAYFLQRRSGFRVLLRSLAGNKAALATGMALMCASSAVAAEGEGVRNVVPDDVARTFGEIYVYWDDRPAPMHTMCRSILTQAYGSDTYRGQSSDQVIVGFIAYYDQWKYQPVIKVKSRRVRELIGIEGKYASLIDFFDADGYKLQPLLDAGVGDNDVLRIDRSVQLLASVAAGSLMRIFPYMSANHRMEWLSWTDRRPSQMPLEQWTVIETSMRDVVTALIMGDADKARSGLLQIRRYQLQTCEAAGAELSQSKFRAEIWYNRMASPLLWSLLLVITALVAAACSIMRACAALAKTLSLAVLAVSAAWLVCLIALRWYIAGHWPLSNGPESMEVMALMALGIGAMLRCRHFVATLLSMIVAGLSLAVAAMSGSAGVLSPLLPVLNNPLLSVHVLVIMLAYALLTIIMLLSVCVLAGSRMACQETRLRMSRLSLVLLYPAVFLLCAGIFIGAIWANQSWGRYWGWDPKETWALITMIVYCAPLHWRIVKVFRNEKMLAWYLSSAYVTVIITYFGVNLFMGGLHSYS